MRISDWSSDVCSSDLTVDPTEFRRLWQAEVDDAAKNHKRERLHLATGLLLPVWDKLPSDYVRVSRISARDGRSLLGREVPLHCVPELCQVLGLEDEHAFSAEIGRASCRERVGQ